MCVILPDDAPPDPGRTPDPDIDLIIQLLEALEDIIAPPAVPESFARQRGD